MIASCYGNAVEGGPGAVSNVPGNHEIIVCIGGKCMLRSIDCEYGEDEKIEDADICDRSGPEISNDQQMPSTYPETNGTSNLNLATGYITVRNKSSEIRTKIRNTCPSLSLFWPARHRTTANPSYPSRKTETESLSGANSEFYAPSSRVAVQSDEKHGRNTEFYGQTSFFAQTR